jgi:hypothetical protein
MPEILVVRIDAFVARWTSRDHNAHASGCDRGRIVHERIPRMTHQFALCRSENSDLRFVIHENQSPDEV